MSMLRNRNLYLRRLTGMNAAGWHWALLLAYLFVFPLPHTTAARFATFYASLVFAAIAWYRGQLEIEWKGAFQLLYLLFVVSALAPLAVYRVDLADSLSAARNNLLEIGFVVLSIAFTRTKHIDRAFEVLRVMSWSYGMFALLAAAGLAEYAIGHGFPWTREVNAEIAFHERFSTVSAVAFTITLGFLAVYWRALARHERVFLGVVLVVAFGLILRYQSFSSFAAILVAALWILARTWPRPAIAVIAVALGAIAAYAVLVPNNQYVAKLQQLAQLDLRQEDALGSRIGLARYVWICGKDAAWFGHGFDSYKMNEVCRAESVTAEALASGLQRTVEVFRDRELNAHNVIMQMFFEQGYTGLALFLALFVTAWIAMAKLRETRFADLSLRLLLPVTAAYWIAGMFNSLWPSNPGKLVFAVIAVALWCERVASAGSNAASGRNQGPSA